MAVCRRSAAAAVLVILAALTAFKAGAEDGIIVQSAHAAKVIGMAVSGGRLGTWDSAGFVKVWDTELRMLERTCDTARSLTAVPLTEAGIWNGRFLFIARTDGSWIRIDPALEAVETVPAPPGITGGVLCAGAGAFLVVSGQHISEYTPATGTLKRLPVPVDAAHLGKSVFHLSEHAVLRADSRGVSVYARDGAPVRTVRPPWTERFHPTSVALYAGSRIAVAASDSTVYLEETAGGGFVRLRGLPATPVSIACDVLVHAVDDAGTAVSWNPLQPADARAIRGTGFSGCVSAGRVLYLPGPGGVLMTEASTGTRIEVLGRAIDTPSRLVPGPGGTLLFTASGRLNAVSPRTAGCRTLFRLSGLMDAAWDRVSGLFAVLLRHEEDGTYLLRAVDGNLTVRRKGFVLSAGPGAAPGNVLADDDRFIVSGAQGTCYFGDWDADESYGSEFWTSGEVRLSVSPAWERVSTGQQTALWTELMAAGDNSDPLRNITGGTVLDIGPGGKTALVISDQGKKAVLVDFADGTRRQLSMDIPIVSGCFSPGGKEIWFSLETGEFLRTAPDGGIVGRFPAGRPVYDLRAAADSGTHLAYGTLDDGRIVFINPGNGTTAYVLSTETDWIIFTDDGYWDGSSGASRLVAFRHEGRLYDVDQFALRSNRPDVIVTRLGGDPAAADAFRDQYRRRLVKSGAVPDRISASDMAPLLKGSESQRILASYKKNAESYELDPGTLFAGKYELLSLPGFGAFVENRLGNGYDAPGAIISGIVVSGKFAEITCTLTAGRLSVTAFNLIVNGIPVFTGAGKPVRVPAGTSAVFTERVELSEGANRLEAVCRDEALVQSFRISRTVTYGGAVSRTLYFCGFGVSEYADPEITDLPFAQKTVSDLAARFQSMKGRGFAEVKTLVALGADAGPKGFSQAAALLAGAGVDDVVVLYFVGHGIGLPGSRGSTYYFVGSTTRLDTIESTGIEYETLENLFASTRARSRLFLLDTCESGEDFSGSGPAAAASADMKPRYVGMEIGRTLKKTAGNAAAAQSREDRYIYNPLDSASGIVRFAAAQGNERAYMDGPSQPSYRRSLFGDSLIAGFCDRAADADRNGFLDRNELIAYVTARTVNFSRANYPTVQHPSVDRDNPDAGFVFPAEP